VIANRFASIADGPLITLRDAGVPVTINTDDPAMEDLDLGREYRNVATAYGLSLEEMGRIAVDGIDSTWLDETDRRSLAADFGSRLSALEDQAGEASRR
jgi:adenine deaminase